MDKRILIPLIMVSVIIIVFLIVLSLPKQECGYYTSTYPAYGTVECTCVGLDHSDSFDSELVTGGAGPIYCKGFCLKNTCKSPDYLIDEEKKDLVRKLESSDLELKFVFQESRINLKLNEEYSFVYALQNIKDEPVEFTINYFCIKSISGTDNGAECTNLNFQKKINLSPKEIKTDSIGIKIEKKESTMWKVNVIDQNNEIYGSESFFVKIE